MSRVGSMNFSMADLYPDMAGNYGTRSLTIPGSNDQMALVDDEEAAKENSVHTTPQQHRNIFVTIVAVLIAICCFGCVNWKNI